MQTLTKLLIAGTAMVAAGFWPFGAQAATRSWDGSNNTEWTNGQNWSGNSAPGSSDTASFDSAFTGSKQPTVNSNVTIGDIILKSNVTKDVTVSGSSGKTLTFSSSTPVTTEASSRSLTIGSNINFTTGGTKTFSVANGTQDVDLNITGSIGEPWNLGLNKTGAGTMKLSGSNTFTGAVTVSQGALVAASNNALGASGTWGNTVENGAALHLTGGITVNEGGMTATGTGVGGTGALRNLAGNNVLNTSLTAGGNTLIQSDAGKLTMQGSLSTGGNTVELKTAGGSIDFQSNASGGGTIIKTGTGTLDLNGGALNTGLEIREGTANLNRTVNTSGNQGPIIGTTSGPAATLKLSANDLIRDDLFVNVKESGTFDLNNKNEGIAGLRLWGGDVKTGSGTLTIANAGGDEIHSYASSQTSTITGKLKSDLAQGTTITVDNGSAATDLDISAAISGSTAKITKNGAGTLQYSGSASNTYTGQTIVNGGTLTLAKTGGATAIAGSSIVVNSGGTLLLGGANQINNNTNLTLNGGTFSTGATTGFAENLGTLTLSSNSIIDLGTGVHLLEFDNSSALTWTGTLTIYGWVGSAGNAGTQGQIFFGNNQFGLNASQLAQISFDGFGAGAKLLGSGQLVPIAVPEAEAVLAAFLICGAVVWIERRRIGEIFRDLRPET